MFDIDQTTIERIIELASGFQMEKEADLIEEINRGEDNWIETGENNEDESELYNEFIAIVENLSQQQQQQLVATLWLGRGDYGMADWQEALTNAEKAWTERTADYLLSHPHFSEDLRAGVMMINAEEVATIT